ncbi:MAG: tetratricopeptide repeat protein [Myxococcota bacterium]
MPRTSETTRPFCVSMVRSRLLHSLDVAYQPTPKVRVLGPNGACLLLLLAAACASSGPPRVEMEPLVVRADDDPLTGLDSYDAEKLFATAAEEFEKGAYDRSVKIYAKLVEEFPESELVSSARYNAGLAFEKLEAWEEAVAEFAAVVRDFAGSDLHRDAHFNLARAYGKVKNWAGVADTFWAARQLQPPLGPMDELEARVGMGVGLFMQDDYATAEREFMRALRFYDEHEQKEFLPAKYFIGQARFYLGEIAARAFEATTLSPPSVGDAETWTQMMGDDLQAKCQLLLRAQSNLIRAIRVGHRGWATAAGFRIGTLYERLFDEMMDVPVPPDLEPDVAEVYREELRERVGVLVKKAIRVYEMNREMAERVGEQNEWVEKTSLALERMKRLYLANVSDT